MTQKLMQIDAPSDAKVSNYLFEDMELFELNQGLLLVELSNGVCIDVGWFPENDPDGAFQVKVSKGWEEYGSSTCETIMGVAERVNRHIERYNRQIVQTSNAANRKLTVCRL